MKFYLLKISDLWLILEAYGDELLFRQTIARKQTELICEVINRTWGGSGVSQAIKDSWPLGNETKSEIDPDKIKRVLALHKPFRHKPIKVGGVKNTNNR